LLPLLSASLLAVMALQADAADGPAAPLVVTPMAVAPPSQLVLPATPSKLLRAPLFTLQPVLKLAAASIDERAKKAVGADKNTVIEIEIQRTLLAQTRQAWPQVIESVKQVRGLQAGASGRHTAGLLNEIIARQSLARGDAAWLRYRMRDQVLAMPWAEVETAIRALRTQLAGMKSEDIENYVNMKLDLTSSITQGRVSDAFLFQVLSLRFQLMDVMPRRAALLAGLDDAIARRDGTGSR